MKHFLFSLLVLIFVTGCATSGKQPPTFEKPTAFFFEKFEVTSPAGWTVHKAEKTSLALGKPLGAEMMNKGVSLVAWIYAYDPQVFANVKSTKSIFEEIKKSKIADSNTGRITSIENTFKIQKINGFECQRFFQKGRDMGADGKIIELVGASCVDPKNTTNIVDIMVSSRYPQEVGAIDYKADTESLINSLKKR